MLIAYFIWQMKQPPPPSPPEVWMKNTGKPWATARPAPPDPLTADVSPNSVPYTSDLQTMRIGFTNTTTAAQNIDYVKVMFTGGSSAAAVFTSNQGFTTADAASAGNTKLSSAPTGCKLFAVNQKSTINTGDMNTTLTVQASNPSSSFAVPPGGRVEIIAYGVVRADNGQTCSFGWTVIGADQVTNGFLEVARAKKP